MVQHLNSKQDSSSFDFFMDEFKETLKDIHHWLMGAGQISRSKAKMLHTTMVQHLYACSIHTNSLYSNSSLIN